MVLDTLIESVGIVLTADVLAWMLVGLIFGIVVGAVPGVGPNLGMAVILPLTVFLDGLTAIIMLICIYNGAMYGGSIASILINTPGNAAAAATTFDGYPMTRQGNALKALAISATSSSFSGILVIVVLLLASPLLISLVLLFGSPEYFLIAVLGLSLITVVSRGSMLKGLTAGSFGLLLTTVGIPVTNFEFRYTFGFVGLNDGISFVIALIGVFAIGEMIRLSSEEGSIAKERVELEGSISDGVREVLVRNPVTFLKSAFIGMGIGAVPGSGASISNFISYGEAMRSENDADTFGNGDPRGVISAEAANNGTVIGSLIPTLSFGIPGSGATAILLGGLIMHGLRPGPDLFGSELYVTYSVLLALLVSNLVILLLGLFIVTRAGHYFTQVDTDLIIPVVISLAVVGSLSLRNNWFDALFVIAFGILGYYMYKHDYSLIAFVLGIVLGSIAEENLHRSLELGGWGIFVDSPLSMLLVATILAIVFGPIVSQQTKRLRNS